MKNKTLIVGGLIIVICVITAIFIGLRKPSNIYDVPTVRVGYHPNFGGSSAVAIAISNGYFNDENLNVELVQFSSGPASMAALEAHDIDISFMGHGAFGLVLQSNTRIFALDSLSYAEEIIARKDSGISSVADLQGKKVAVPYGTSGENFLRSVSDVYNLDYREINTVNMDVLGCVTAIDKGFVDAVSIWAPFTNDVYRKTENLVSIANCTDYEDILFLPMYWVVDSIYLEENPEIMFRFTKALQRALDWRRENLENTARLVGDMINKDYRNLIPDTQTAHWFTSQNLKEYLQDNSVQQWFKHQYEFLSKYEVVPSDIDIDAILAFDMLEKIVNEMED